MKIAITGAMGVGKTTLTNQIARATNIQILPEVARQMIAKGFNLDKKATPELEIEMLNCQKSLEATECNSWISDRCLVDLLAYSKVLFPKDVNLHEKIDDELINATYDIFIYVPPEFEIENDGVRSTDKEFQTKIDFEIRSIVEMKMNAYKVTGSREERLEQALAIIKAHNLRI